MPHAAKAARPGAERTCLGGSLRAVRGEEERHSEVQAATLSFPPARTGLLQLKGDERWESHQERRLSLWKLSSTKRHEKGTAAPKTRRFGGFQQACWHAVPFRASTERSGHGRKSSKKKGKFRPGREPPRRAAERHGRCASSRRFRWRARHAAKEGRPRSPPRPRPSRAGKLTFLRVPSSLEANRRKDARGRLLQLQRMRQVPHLDEGPRRRLPLL